ncbi:hypothetical protein OJF2_53710 [Aquisphaera giovannonii]|uniref:Uncharacterized protein n=1 Tax=Aquisphaera giovannonii TaxID=406548 RepID=A0A5B9W7X7_9BACT|nr:hypothetical protein [Aquisphaera giovannonii]QEH36786.1 hypothetical protein OJF2_53710 [Aquisphaera giovannonii]
MQPGRETRPAATTDPAATRPVGSQAADAGPDSSRRRPPEGRRTWLEDPRSFVLIVLGAVAAIGIAWKLLLAWRTRLGVSRLLEPDVTPEEVAGASRFQRAGLMELFRIMGDPESRLTPAHREAAAAALATLWAEDQLVAEEEQAFVRRGYVVDWKARRRYPRALACPLPIAVHYGVPALRASGPGVHADNLEWSHRILGARRASLEQWSPWAPGAGRPSWEILPGDFEGMGPHRLVLEARVRTRGLTSSWEIELPKVPFPIELDPRLEVGSLLASPDQAHARAMEAGLGLESDPAEPDGPATFLPLGRELAVRNPPHLVIRIPLPRDLAHRMFLEIDGVPGRFRAGDLVLSGQGAGRGDEDRAAPRPLSVPIRALEGPEQPALERPGTYRARMALEPDEALGWSDPEIRSVWPTRLDTEWVPLEIVRR